MRKETLYILTALLLVTEGDIPQTQAQPLGAGTEPVEIQDGVLVDEEGMTLYTSDRDSVEPSKSVCNGQCADNWPPLLAQEGDQAGGDWSIIEREDKRLQWTYKGQPLYHWSKDDAPGDMGGEGMAGNTWHVAKP